MKDNVSPAAGGERRPVRTGRGKSVLTRPAWLWNGAAALLFPYRCPVCDEPNGRMEPSFCGRCREAARFLEGPVCEKCGRRLRAGEGERCGDCLGRRHRYTAGRALFEYGEAAPSLYRFKYQGRREYAGAYAAELYERLGEEIRGWRADGIVPVPLHRTRKRKRGYNQAYLLAKELGKRFGIPVYGDLVRRVRNTVPQKRLNAAGRQNNLKKAFKIVRNDVKLSTIIIVDDIYTTGRTVDEISGALLEGAAGRVYFLTVAIGTGL